MLRDFFVFWAVNGLAGVVLPVENGFPAVVKLYVSTHIIVMKTRSEMLLMTPHEERAALHHH